MNDIASERVGLMANPPHLGELLRESMALACGAAGCCRLMLMRCPLSGTRR